MGASDCTQVSSGFALYYAKAPTTLWHIFTKVTAWRALPCGNLSDPLDATQGAQKNFFSSGLHTTDLLMINFSPLEEEQLSHFPTPQFLTARKNRHGYVDVGYWKKKLLQQITELMLKEKNGNSYK